ncbi:MAG TPA: aromatic ring-hydroxylating dioxygenase subunit alpha [Eoetvoesiella sp.]|uniref:aromatic ring-hydroxylating dioxygenase subunit alpha n=1 Tax=Eoetvoesiella sp. TaxID=1966355 RepID=UPI002CEA9C0A|nr:aromatic ring-hydroxylating dioxygenase subunit alpha [Eoetvoesiella sp.]HWK62104.1 aromatic ring-hydroxylating dioxygenase subunit alpha [Eoetvoesiella sp.]
MLSEEKNRLLTQVGPGTPMGDYLRRYWHPIAGVSEFEDRDTKPVRIMGEDLVLYRDLGGNYGLVDRHCPHRRADMSYGYVEKEGIRCSYHGWQYDVAGQCTHQPFEEMMDPQARMRKQTRIKAYPVKAKAGMLWAYMGPAPAPELPDWDLFNFENGFAQAIFAELPCNWFQCQENSIDPVHFEWTHNNWMTRMSGSLGPYVPTHTRLDFQEFDYGFIYRRLRGTEDESNVMWTVGRVTLWPNGFYLGHHFEWRVPIDDENTLSVLWVFSKVPKEQEPYVQKSIPSWHGPVKDPETGRWITSHVANQDFVAWAGQGVITDRTQERLGQSDKGIVMMRQRFFRELEEMRTTPDFVPKGLILDPEQNRDVKLPSACWEELKHGLPREQLATHPLLGSYLGEFFGQAGQPESVRLAFEQAIGQKIERSTTFKVHGSRQEEHA